MKIKIRPYSIEWQNNYQKLRSVYIKYLKGLYIDIQHVGSTSVEGLAAKPIIDIDIIIDHSETSLPPIIDQLKKLGYIYQGMMGIPGRHSFAQGEQAVPFRRSKSFISHNLYVCERGCIALENHIRFRDYLRSHPDAVEEYANLKYRIAKLTGNINEYVEQKTEFIINTLKKCGLEKDAIEEIESSNKLTGKNLGKIY